MNRLAVILDRPIAFHRCLVTVTGTIKCALFLSQAIYWTKRTGDPDGWFWKTRDQWEDETALTRYEQESVRHVLRNLKILEEKNVGLPAKLHFRINFQVLESLLEKEVPHQGGGKLANTVAENCPAIISTETTTETTVPPIVPQGGQERASKPEGLSLNMESSSSFQKQIEQGFDAFWRDYPNKKAKADAQKAWKQVKACLHLEAILNALASQRRCDQWQRDNGRYIPLPATWLRQNRWEDEDPVGAEARRRQQRELDRELEAIRQFTHNL